tara:strand:- start:2120 stop:4315 length:2196 start_codon:yes stop_codon:yes gene_type:complete
MSDEEKRIEQAMRNSLITASRKRRQREAEKAQGVCAEKKSCGGESALTPTLREDAYSNHIPENNWYEINELQELDYFKTGASSKVFGDRILGSKEFKALIPHFLSRSVPGDGFCLIRTVEALINKRHQYIENLPSRLEQTTKLKKIIDTGEPKPDEILRGLGQADDYAKQLNLEGGFEGHQKKGDFSSLDFNWVYIMAVKEDVRIVVFINSSTNKDMKHKIVYPVKDTDPSFKKYKSIDKTIFILNNGGHYYPLKLKETSKNNTNLIKDLVEIWSNTFGNAIDTYTEIIVPGGESSTPTNPGGVGGESKNPPPPAPTPSLPPADPAPKTGKRRLLIIKKSDLSPEQQKLVKANVSKKIKSEEKEKRFVFKQGFLENLKEYFVLTDDFPKTEGALDIPPPGHLVYKEHFSLDEGYKYKNEKGEEVKFMDKILSSEKDKILPLHIKTQHIAFDEKNENYYDLRRQYLNSQHFVTLDSFLNSERFNDRAAHRMENTTYMLDKNIHYDPKTQKLSLIPFYFEPDKSSLDDINKNISNEMMEYEKDKKNKENSGYMGTAAGMVAGGTGIIGTAAAIGGSASSVALGVASGGVGILLGAGAYGAYKARKYYKETKEKIIYADRFKKQLHRIVHIITFATELKRKYKKDQHLIDEWKNTLINIHLKRIYDNMARDSVTNKLNFEAESALSSERKEAQEKIKKEKKKGYFGRRRERKKIKKLEKQQQAQTQTQAQMFRK